MVLMIVDEVSAAEPCTVSAHLKILRPEQAKKVGAVPFDGA
jgi:hypothetical protein